MALDHVAPDASGLTNLEVAAGFVLDRGVVPDEYVVFVPIVGGERSIRLGMILK